MNLGGNASLARRLVPIAAGSVRPAIYFGSLVLLLGPVFAVGIPALLDYPDHLARMYLLSRNSAAEVSPFYEIHWALYPNLAMDLVVPLMARFIGVATATKVFYLVSQLVVIGGALTLERVVKGRIALAPVAVALFLYSPPFAWGFVNFEFGFGIALLAIATFLAMEARTPRALVHSSFVVILFAAHLFALGIYGATVVLHELWRRQSHRASLREIATSLAILAAPATIVLGITVLSGAAIGGAKTEWDILLKPAWIALAMSGYSSTLSAVGMFFVVSACFILARRGQLTLMGGGAWIAAGFAFIYLVMPFRPFDTAFADIRVLTAAAFIVPAFIQLKVPSAAGRLMLASVAVGLIVANVVIVWSVWLSYRAEYAAVLSSFDKIPRGAIIIVAISGEREPLTDLAEYPIYHAPSLAVPRLNAFVSTFYASPGKQPVALQPAYKEFAALQGVSVPIRALRAIVAGTISSAPEALRSWPTKFDYLYVVGRRSANPMPSFLSELASGSRFVLYRIEKENYVQAGRAANF